MIVCGSIPELKRELAALRNGGAPVALVPTMGALHDGHLALVDAANEAAEIVVMSIFVNPLQFGPGEDLSKYPREESADVRLASERGVDLLFIPKIDEIYPPGQQTISVSPGRLGELWEGSQRPGHFEGVLTIVSKLLNIVQPELVYFGQKDLQQFTLVTRMVSALSFPTEVRMVPTVRDSDGLALSSRNRFLDPTARKSAIGLPNALRAVAAKWRDGERSSTALNSLAAGVLSDAGIVSVDYIAIVEPLGLEPVEFAKPGTVVAIAVRVGTTRLLDNLILKEDDV